MRRARLRNVLWAFAATTIALPLLPTGTAHAQETTPAATATADVVINLNAPGPVTDRHVYGQFAEHLGRGIY